MTVLIKYCYMCVINLISHEALNVHTIRIIGRDMKIV